MSQISMNAGWEHQPIFDHIEVGEGTKAVQVWPNYWTQEALDFNWLNDPSNLSQFASPFMARSSGVRGMGGTWDLVALDWFERSGPQVQQSLLSIAQDDALLAQSDVLHVRVHTGQFYDESAMWVEMFNPFTFQREHMAHAAFDAFGSQILKTISALGDAPEHAAVMKERIAMAHFHRGAQRYLASASLMLASLFAHKRIAFETITQLVLRMPRYEQVYRCLQDLPDDGSGSFLSFNRLLALYG